MHRDRENFLLGNARWYNQNLVNDCVGYWPTWEEGEWVFNTTFFDPTDPDGKKTLGPIFNRIGKLEKEIHGISHNAIWGRFYLKTLKALLTHESSFIFTIDNPYAIGVGDLSTPTSVQRIRNSELPNLSVAKIVLETRRYYDWDGILHWLPPQGYFSDRAIMLSSLMLTLPDSITGKTVGFVIGTYPISGLTMNKLDTTRDYYSRRANTPDIGCLVMANIGKVKWVPHQSDPVGVRLTGAGNIVCDDEWKEKYRTGVLYNINGQPGYHYTQDFNPDDAHDVVVVVEAHYQSINADVPVETHLCPNTKSGIAIPTLGKGLPKLEFYSQYHLADLQNRTDTLQDWLCANYHFFEVGLEALGAEYTFFSRDTRTWGTIDVTQPLNTLP
ncbi:hypothetical protein SPFM20_00102 [Salmonella phage SPFM20]|nr:hypothetical protein SPFM20_00102 [Salmonella phage SPFM20]